MPHPDPADTAAAGRGVWERWLLHTVDAALVVALAGVPLLLGGRIAWGQWLLVVCAGMAAAAWCLRQALARQAAWTSSAADVLLALGVGLVALQLLPLPPPWLAAMSPRLYEALPLWSPDGPSDRLGTWSTLSLAPAETRAALVVLAATGLLLLVGIQRLGRLEDVERLIRLMALLAAAMAIVALAQHLGGRKEYFGWLSHPLAPANAHLQGSFTNRNHFAHYLVLGLGPLIWCTLEAARDGSRGRHGRHRGSRRPGAALRTTLWTLAAVLTTLVCLLTLSRGAVASLLLAGGVMLAILIRAGGAGGRLVAGLSGGAILLGVSLWVYGADRVSTRLADFASLDALDTYSARRSIWAANLAAVRDYPWTGAGLGSHETLCPIYLRGPVTTMDLVCTHAESGYLQVASETGLPGLALALAAVGTCVAWCLRAARRTASPRALRALAAVAPGLAANFAHGAVDFLWYVPGCMVGAVLLAAAARRLAGLGADGRPAEGGAAPLPRAAWLTGGVVLIVVGAWMAGDRFHAAQAEAHWHRYLFLSQAERAAEQDASSDGLRAMAGELAEAVRHQPDHAAAHFRLARLHLRQFDAFPPSDPAPYTVVEVRQTVADSRFSDSAALDRWLRRAFPHRSDHLVAAWAHACRGLQLAPLDGGAYLILAELSFLEGPRAVGSPGYVDQALRLRPCHSDVLLAAGQEAALQGDETRLRQFWQAAYRQGPSNRRRLIELLASRLPAVEVVTLFQPDRLMLDYLAALYHRRGQTADARYALRCCGEAALADARRIEGTAAALVWWQAADVYGRLGDVRQRTGCLEEAIRCDFSFYDAHYALGVTLRDRGDYTGAREHLDWCARRRPEDAALRALLEELADAQLRGTAPEAGKIPAAWVARP